MWKFKISSLFACFVLICADDATESKGHLRIITSSSIHENIFEVGKPFWLLCNFDMPGAVWWMKDNRKVTDSGTHRVPRAEVSDSGSYTCVANSTDRTPIRETIVVTVLETGDMPAGKIERVRSGSPATLKCDLRGNSEKDSMWEKIGEPNKTEILKPLTDVSIRQGIYVQLTLNFRKVTPEKNGTYVCRTKDLTSGNISMSTRVLVVTDQPEAKIVSAKAIGGGKVYLNWTVNDHNEPVTEYKIEYQSTTGNWKSQMDEIDPGSFSFVVNGLEIGTAYRFKISATNSLGNRMPEIYPNYVNVTDQEPEYIPTIKVAEKTNSSITIDISPPPADLKDFDFYYNVTITDGVNMTRGSYSETNARAVIIDGLEPETNYNVRVAACNFYTKTCGGWSASISDDSMGSSSSTLYPEWVNLVIANTVFLYFAVKHLFT